MCFTPVVSCIDRLPRGYLKGPRACLPRAAWSCGWASVVADVSRAAPSYAMICTSRGRETSTGRGHKKRCVYLVIIGCVIGWFSCVRDEAVVDQTDQADQLFNDLPTRGVKNWEFNGGPNDYDYVFDAVRLIKLKQTDRDDLLNSTNVKRDQKRPIGKLMSTKTNWSLIKDLIGMFFLRSLITKF